MKSIYAFRPINIGLNYATSHKHAPRVFVFIFLVSSKDTTVEHARRRIVPLAQLKREYFCFIVMLLFQYTCYS